MNRYMSTYDEEQVPAPIPSATPSNKSRKVAPTVPLPTMAECRAFFEEWTSDLDCYALWKPRFLALAVDVQDSYDNELASDMATRQARAKTVVRRIKQHPDRASQKGFQVGLLNELHQLELDGVISRTTFDEDLFEAVKLARTEQELRNIYPEDVTLKLLAQIDVNVTQIEQARHEYAELCKTHAQTAEAFKPSISSTGLPTETELRARHRLGKSDLERLLQEEQEARGIADRCTLLQYVRQKLATEDEVKQFKAHEAALCRRYERENAERIADQRAFKWRNNAHYGWGLQQAVARQRGLAVTIDSAVAEALCQRPCFYCDEFPDDRNITSIDRLDSHVGYEPGNCVPCCQRCNWAKNAHTVDEFLQLVENIILHRRGEAGRFGFQRYLYRTTQPTLASYRIGAERRRREFLLTTSEFDAIVREPCHYCGIASGSNHWNGIDRIDSEGDYVTGNVVSACKPCNMMKNKWSMEGFFVHCEKIHARAQLIRENLKSI